MSLIQIIAIVAVVVIIFVVMQPIRKKVNIKKHLEGYGNPGTANVLPDGKVEYEVDGKIYKSVPLGYKQSKDYIGKTISIIYDPDNAETCMIEAYQNSSITLLFIVLKLLFLLVLIPLCIVVLKLKA